MPETITSAAASENVVPPPTATGTDITNATGAFAAGNGGMIVTVFYSIITLG